MSAMTLYRPTRRRALLAFAAAAIPDRDSFFLPPSQPAARGARPWLWFAPTLTGNYPNAQTAWLFGELRQRGFSICGMDVGESYGNPAGRAAFTRLHKWATRERGLAPRACLLPQSRGGLMLYNWAAEHAQSVACIGGIYPVCDLRSYPGLERAAPAYGMTAAELESHLAEHNPIDRLAPLAAARVPILHLHGNADKVVPLEANSAELIRRYKTLGGPGELEIIEGKGHAEVPEFFHSERLLEFFTREGLGRSS